MRANKEDGILAPPESSDEDDERNAEAKEDTVPVKPVAKRGRGPSNPTSSRASKRAKLKDSPQLDDIAEAALPDADSAATTDLFGMPSSSSQSQSMKKKRKGYGGRHTAFKQPDEPLRQQPVERVGASFVALSAVPNAGIAGAEPRSTLKIKDPLPSLAEHPPQMKMIPDLEPEPTSSSSTSTGLVIFDLPEPLKNVHARRSASVSSITSLTSAGDLEEDQPLENRLKSQVAAEEASSKISCPVCGKKIDRSDLTPEEVHSRTLSLQNQQDFCYKHRIREASALWQERGYPSIDWHELEFTRVPKQAHHLRTVLQRKVTSHYLQQLDSQISSAKANRKATRTYLLEGILDVAKQGYYGPRGAKVMVQAITQHLAKDLRKAVQSDKAVRTAGVGPFVSAVLVPELTMRLVMEDLGIRSQTKARDVLVESTEMGLLLHPDDDHVERDEEG